MNKSYMYLDYLVDDIHTIRNFFVFFSFRVKRLKIICYNEKSNQVYSNDNVSVCHIVVVMVE